MTTYGKFDLNENQRESISLDKMYGKHYDNLVLFAKRLLKSNMYAQDTVQDVFVSLCKQEFYFLSELVLINYIYRSVYNKCIDNLRRKQMIQRHEEIYVEEYKFAVMSIANSILYEELFTIVENRIDHLPPKCRLIFSMKYRKQQSNPEISETLGLSLKTVENQVFIARNVLKNYLRPYLCS